VHERKVLFGVAHGVGVGAFRGEHEIGELVFVG
jgi:hypothetical protein